MQVIVVSLDDHEVLAFETEEQAKSFVEPYDIDSVEVYDADGVIYKPIVIEGGWLKPDVVVIEKTNTRNLARLHESVIKYLHILGLQDFSEQSPTYDLIKLLPPP